MANELVGHETAFAFIDTIEDGGVKSALEHALTTVITSRGMDPRVEPNGGFDLRFFLEAVKAMFEDQAVISAIADGSQDRLRW